MCSKFHLCSANYYGVRIRSCRLLPVAYQDKTEQVMEKVKLIQGKFSAEEAREILLNMIGSKVQFHTIKDFSSEIREGSPDFNSRERLSELRKAKDKVIALLEKAEKENMEVNIESSIQISFSSKEKENI